MTHEAEEVDYQALLNELKTCRHCGVPKTVLDFARNAKTRNGLSSWCRECHVARTAQWRADKRDEAENRRRAEYAAQRAELLKQEREWRRRVDRRLERERRALWG